MELRDYLRILRKRWRIVTLMALLCLGGATAATLLTTPTYQSTTQLFVSTQGGSADNSQLLQGSSFTQQRVKSYADIVTSPSVLDPVISRLGLTTTSDKLANSITGEAPLDTVLINISVTNGSALAAQQIANEVGKQFAQVIATLEKPEGGGATPVKISVVQPADLQTAPVSPKVARNLALGLVLGLMVGVGAAVLRETLDNTVKSESDVKEITGLPVLGAIAFDPEAAKRPLIVHADPHGARSEAFRQLRTSLQFVDAADHPRSILITSCVPGEGKSTSTANLAITLAAAGLSVVLVEGDLRRPKAAEYLGLEGAVGLTNVLIGQAALKDVLQPWGKGKISVLACGPIPPNPSELLGSQGMADVLRELEASFDYVLIDCPPLLPVTDAAVVSRLAGGAIIVVGSGRINRDQLVRATDILAAVDARVLGTLVNLLPTSGPDAYDYYAHGYRSKEETTTPRSATSSRRVKATRRAAL